MKSMPVEQIRRRYKNEWLLIAVEELDESSTTPRKGRLIAHSKDRERVYDRLLRTRVKLPLVAYSEDSPPQGYAVAF